MTDSPDMTPACVVIVGWLFCPVHNAPEPPPPIISHPETLWWSTPPSPWLNCAENTCTIVPSIVPSGIRDVAFCATGPAGAFIDGEGKLRLGCIPPTTPASRDREGGE